MLFLARSMDKLEQMMREADQPSLLANDPEDRGRLLWLLTGGILTFVTGVAMLAGARISIYLLLAMVAHQAMYLARQKRRLRGSAFRFSSGRGRSRALHLECFWLDVLDPRRGTLFGVSQGSGLNSPRRLSTRLQYSDRVAQKHDRFCKSNSVSV